jgi:hypothetical protein
MVSMKIFEPAGTRRTRHSGSEKRDSEVIFLGQILAKLLVCVGIMVTVVSCVLGSVVGSGAGGVPILGIGLIIAGAVMWKKTATKLCPACAERVKYQARKCEFCGADVGN